MGRCPLYPGWREGSGLRPGQVTGPRVPDWINRDLTFTLSLSQKLVATTISLGIFEKHLSAPAPLRAVLIQRIIGNVGMLVRLDYKSGPPLMRQAPPTRDSTQLTAGDRLGEDSEVAQDFSSNAVVVRSNWRPHISAGWSVVVGGASRRSPSPGLHEVRSHLLRQQSLPVQKPNSNFSKKFRTAQGSNSVGSSRRFNSCVWEDSHNP